MSLSDGYYGIDDLIPLLMGDEKKPFGGYRPVYVKKRIERLLEIEKAAREICRQKLFKQIAGGSYPCPYCGYRHG